jgi:hypothetical protein
VPKDRANDTRRFVGSHSEMMGALGRAAGWRTGQKLAMGPGTKVFTPGAGHVQTGQTVDGTFIPDYTMPRPVEY